ncbi:uncharacterized protein BP5553_06442 [Venustampulla echinocandica]|uniref:EthD domain-containing protein n=1 Tax=Venustampulla echinocandica TaxID=2656787 RepID=A0A370TJX8_9HELO|nr:uncharacterized protein BP5553_06442 [Venustampulla echinocandica]RDL35830.1 hypothetical protein BP5553_06442 [Venustampulla echinocandica]
MPAQALLKRNPALTKEQFSEYWYNNHALCVVPMFLHCGVQSYAQVHGPLHTNDPELSTTLSEWDGAAETELTPLLLAALTDPSSVPKWIVEYHHHVMLQDERQFLTSEAMQHLKQVGEGTVTGVRKVIIENGKCVVEIPESVWSVWREYEKKGNAEHKF